MWLADRVIAADVDDDESYGVDFTDKLPTGVTISSVAVEESTKVDDVWTATSDLTITPAINGTAYDYSIGQRDYTAAIGTFVAFDIADAAEAEYRLKFKATCSDTKVRSVTCRFSVVEGLTQE